MSNSRIFPDYLEAGSSKGLQRLLIRVYNKLHASNIDIKQFVTYVDTKGEVRFGCWYYTVLDNELVEKVVSDGG